MIQTQGLSKAYGSSLVVDEVSISLAPGGVTSIIGPNGAGKSTLLSLVSRLLPMSAGTVTVDGLDVTSTPGDVLARKLSVLRQENSITTRLTVRDLVTFGRFPHCAGNPTQVDLEHVERALDYLSLRELQDRFLDQLSGGQRQRAYVAMVLCQDTDWVLLDEPLNSLDMRHASEMMRLLRRLADDHGKSMVVVLHDINFASCYSDNIIAMKNGKVRHSGPPEAIMRSEVLSDIYEMEIPVGQVDGRLIGFFYL